MLYHQSQTITLSARLFDFILLEQGERGRTYPAIPRRIITNRGTLRFKLQAPRFIPIKSRLKPFRKIKSKRCPSPESEIKFKQGRKVALPLLIIISYKSHSPRRNTEIESLEYFYAILFVVTFERWKVIKRCHAHGGSDVVACYWDDGQIRTHLRKGGLEVRYRPFIQ